MKLLKNLSKTFKKAGNSIGNVASEVGERTVDLASDIGERTVDVARDVGDVTVDIAKDVGETGKKVGNVVIDVTAPVVEVIDEIDHFAKTGDFGHAIVKLQEEQDKEQARLETAIFEHSEASRDYVAAVLKRRTLSVLHELETEAKVQKAKGVRVEKIEADLYGNGRTKMLERLGLDDVALGLKFIGSIIPMQRPDELIVKQFELAKVRKKLRQNIKALRKSTAQIKRNALELIDQTNAVHEEIEVLEDKVNALNLDPDAHGATILRNAEIQNEVAVEMARELLAAGLAPADIAAATGLDLKLVSALAEGE